MQAYKNLEAHFERIVALRSIDAVLNWDKSVMMPQEGSRQRAHELGVLSIQIHELQTDPRIGDWLAAVDRKTLSPWQAANITIMERLYTHATAVPADLIAKKTELETKTEVIWRQARADSDFRRVAPDLENLLGVVRDIAGAKSAKMNIPVYDALMDPYVPGMTYAEVGAVFDDFSAFLPRFLDEVISSQKEPLPLPEKIPVHVQEQLGRKIAAWLGFDFVRGRLDVSTHPFSTGVGDDIRITARYRDDDFTAAIQSIVHETGHGLFDRYTPQEWHRQPVGLSNSMGMAIHESQSLSLDMQLQRSPEFWEFLAPHVQAHFSVSGPAWSAENLYRLVTKVERGFIRVESDEVTYPAHVILRTRFEKEMIEGKLNVKDLPEAWNAGMKELLGVTPPNDRLGCLQDIHWYSGHFGYFPAYALGAMIAAQFVDKMRRDIPNVFDQARAGHFGIFTGWLKDNVQSQCCLYQPQELIQRASGAPFSVQFFKNHLSQRYLGKPLCQTTSVPGEKRRA